MRRLIAAIALVASFSVSAGRCDESQDANGTTARPLVIQVRLEDEAITPITARFVGRAIDMAGDQRAECLVIVLDTPGGLVDSTRQMVKDILRSEVPVIVHVAPPGGRAASAGVFITMAAHVSAMAPGTNIGAAHPVALGEAPFPVADWPDDEEDQEEPDAGRTPDEEKAINDTVAWVRALAELRNRNADWATEAVRESRSVSANVAVEQGAVDLLADDLDDLLTKIHGRQVQTPRGEVTLNTRQATIRHHQMWWGEQILATLAHPNLAVLLLVFGFYGVIFELYSPGWGVAGTLGALCLILAFLAMSILPINYVGLLLLALALALFVAEVFVTSFGALTVTGAVCLVLGGLLLVDSPAGFTGVSLNLLIPLADDRTRRPFTGRNHAGQRLGQGQRGGLLPRDRPDESDSGGRELHAEVIKDHPMAMQMRFLQTLADVGTENNTTIVFPLPVELFGPLLPRDRPSGSE